MASDPKFRQGQKPLRAGATGATVDDSSVSAVDVTTTTFTTTHTRRIISDTHLMKAYTALKDAVEAIKQDDDPDMADDVMVEPISCPSLVVTGTQSAGKTTFIETMVGFPVGYTARGTGTRCPVRYILRPSATPRYKVDGVDVDSRNGLLEAVNRKMRSLEKLSKFEDAPITAEISESGVMDMDIIDLPGLKTEDHEDQEQIVSIVRKYLNKPDVTPVVLTRAMQSPDNQHDIEVLKHNGLRLNKSILIINGVNDTLRHIHTIAEVNAHFQEYLKWGNECKAVRFAMFHPTLHSSIDKDGMKPAEVEEFYKTLPAAEIADLDAYLDSPTVKGGTAEDLDHQIRSRFGVTNSHLALLEELQNWTKLNGNKTAAKLSNKMPPLRASQRRIQDMIDKQKRQVDNMDANILLYSDKYLSSMASIRKNVDIQLQAPAHDSSFDGVINPLVDADPSDMALTYEEEVRMLNTMLKNEVGPSLLLGNQRDPDHRVWLNYSELNQELDGSHIGESLSQRLTCASSIRRLVKIVGYQIMRRDMKEYTKEEIMSKHQPPLMGDSHAASVIRQLVGDQIRTVFQDVFPRLLEHIRFLCERPMSLAHFALAKGFPDIGQLHDLHNTLNETFSKWLSESLRACNAHLVAMMTEKTTSFPVDIDNRLIQLMRLTPMDDALDLLPDLVKDADGQADSDPEGELTSTADHGAHKHTAPYQAYMSVRRAVRESNRGDDKVQIIDFVQGGLTGIPTSEIGELHTLVNRIGKKFFMQVKGLLVMELESKIEMYLLHPLSHSKGSDDALHHEIRQAVSEFMKSPDYKKSLEDSLGTAELDQMLSKKKDRQRKIEEALRTLNKNLHGHQPHARL